jgi:S-adenosylmethionine hydrolase
VAAHLSLGITIDALGPPMAPTQLVSIRSSMAQWNAVTDEITGEITGADRFGNLRTNIDAALVDLFAQKHGGESLVVQVGGQRIEGICATYSARANGQIMALMGSRNRLEIAVRGGNAAQMFESPKDLRVKITAVHTVETMKGK